MYYLCIRRKRKDGKRHILDKYENYSDALARARKWDNPHYELMICSGDWMYTVHLSENMLKKGE